MASSNSGRQLADVDDDYIFYGIPDFQCCEIIELLCLLVDLNILKASVTSILNCVIPEYFMGFVEQCLLCVGFSLDNTAS